MELIPFFIFTFLHILFALPGSRLLFGMPNGFKYLFNIQLSDSGRK